MKIIQVSDTHIVEPGGLLYGISPQDRLAQCVRHINREHRNAFVCIVSGDLVNTGKPEEYREFQRVMDELAIPYVPMVGNHDDREHLQQVLGRQPGVEGGYLQEAIETEEALLLTLDTLEPGKDSGRFCEARQDWLAAHLARAAKPVLLFMHHPPVAIGHVWMDGTAVQEKAEFMALLGRFRDRIAHVFFGHVHRAFFAVVDGISFSSVPSSAHQVSLSGMTEGKLRGCYEPPCYGVVDVSGDAVRLHYQPFLESPQFRF